MRLTKNRILALLLLLTLVLAGVACGSPAAPVQPTPAPGVLAPETPAPEPGGGVAKFTDDGRRIITIGTWYDRYYVSKHKDIYDDPKLAFPETAQMRLDKIREIEQKYNIVLNYVNLTFEGEQESINTSIPEGTPDVDVYEVDAQYGIPAVLNGYAVSLEEMDLAGTDVMGDQQVMKYMNLMGQEESYLFAPTAVGAINSYPLAFNLDLIRAAGLENPQDLYDRGEWTWAKWSEYLQKLTQDSDDDGNTDVYGFSGYWTHMFRNLMFANGTGIAAGREETLSSPATREVLDFIYKLYNVDHVGRPWDESNWNINNELYAAGLSGFWVASDWLFDEQGGADLPFEIGVVPWPCGPSGDYATNKQSSPQTNWYFIPRGIQDPRLVYDVIFDWLNWYDYDLSIGIDMEWSKKMYINERNYSYAAEMDNRPGFDLWENIGVGFTLVTLLSGEQTVEDVINAYSATFQEALDSYFGK